MKTTVMMIALSVVMANGKRIHPDDEDNTFECSESEAKALSNIGAAKRVEVHAFEQMINVNSGNEGAKDPLLTKTIKELEALAQERNVVFPEGITKKADIIAFLNSDEGQGEA